MMWRAAVVVAVALASVVSARPRPFFAPAARNVDPYPDHPPLHFKHSSFKLMVVSDTHLLDGQGNQSAANVAKYNKMAHDAVVHYIHQEKPDYIVHNGDFISGESANNTAQAKAAVREILGPIIAARIPFSSTKGNHDNEKYTTHGLITDWEHHYAPRLSYSRKAPPGVGGGEVGSDNYWVPIYRDSRSRRGDKPALLLWFFDSRSGKTMLDEQGHQKPVDDFVDPTVGPWIQAESERLAKAWGGSLPPSIIFTHIPSHPFVATQQDAPYAQHVGGVTAETSGNFTSEGRTYPGLNEDHTFGGQDSSNGPYAGRDRAYLDAFFSQASATSRSKVHAIVSGHQHGLDWCAPSKLEATDLVPVCFAKHSSFSGYDYENWNHGVRVFNFDLSNVATGADTYIRLLTGEKHYQTTLDHAFLTRVPK
ncbi:unnamed protein product [Parajaminaea phylloscopi]